MSFNTDGVVLKVVKTGESDRFVTLLTQERGVLEAFAGGAGRPKNKLHGSTNLFCCGHYSFFETGKTPKVTECEIRDIFYGLRDDIRRLSLAQYMNELMLELGPADQEAGEALRLHLNSLHFLASGALTPEQLKPMYELRLLSESGYMPDIAACDKCGTFETPVMQFDPVTGKLLCGNCSQRGKNDLPLAVVNAMRHIVLTDLPRMFRLRAGGETLALLSQTAERYLLEKLQRPFAALSFYKSIK